MLALSLVLLALSARDSAAQTFNPTSSLSLSTGAVNTPADMITDFNLPQQDVFFRAIVGFIPPEWGVASAGDLAIGTQVGTLNSVVTLGLLNGPCATHLPVHFDLLNGSVNTADTISGLPSGVSNRLQPLADDASPANGIPDGVDRYPDYLNDTFPGLTPRARLVGITIIGSAGHLPVVLNFNIFEVGTQIPASDLIQDPPVLDPALGFPSATVLQDPTEPAAPSAVTAFCAPLTANTVTFDNIRTNPGPGTYTFVTFFRGQGDADGDGFENFLDTCPFDPNNENPKIPGISNDPDVDGIDSACDNTGVFTDGNTIPWRANSLCRAGSGDDFLGVDCDQDGFLNRGDNCPQHANPLQEDDDTDGIGNVCDIVGAGGIGKGPSTPDGAFIELCLARAVTIPGDGTSVAVAPPSVPPCVAVLPVSIDIKPGGNPNSVHPDSRGKIPLAILSTADFDATTEVDQSSLTFGSSGDDPSLAFCPRGAQDVNDDGLVDLVCHFHTQDTGFQCGDTEGILRGENMDGVPIEGSDSVRLVPCR